MITPSFETVSRLLKPISPKESFHSMPALEAEISRYIKIGHHPVSIWQNLLGLSEEEMSDALNVQDGAEFRALKNNENGPYFSITAEQVLSFCTQYGLHPADLVPSVNDPKLSYPHAIFRANLFILDDKTASTEDRKKANQAVQIEKKRYQDLVKPSSCPMNLHEALDRAVKSAHLEEVINVFGDRELCYLNFAQLIIGRANDIYDDKDAKERKLYDKIKSEHSQKRTEFIRKLRQTFYGLSSDEQVLLNASIRSGQEWTEPTLERHLHKLFISEPRHRVGMEFMWAFTVNPNVRVSSEFSKLATLFIEERTLQRKMNENSLPVTTRLKEMYGELSEWFVSGAADHLRHIVANKIYMDIRERDLQTTPHSEHAGRKIRLG